VVVVSNLELLEMENLFECGQHSHSNKISVARTAMSAATAAVKWPRRQIPQWQDVVERS
jgi:hypothetical protein